MCTVFFDVAYQSYLPVVVTKEHLVDGNGKLGATQSPRLLGRMNAAVRWVVWGTIPLGALLGGVLGTLVGIRATLWIAFAAAGRRLVGVLLAPPRAA